MKLTRERFEEAGRAACRKVWRDMAKGHDWDRECPDKDGWLREELNALKPALEYLGVEVPTDEVLEGELCE